MEFVKLFTSDKKELEDKIIIIDFVMNLVKKDLKYDALTTILYQEEHFERDLSTPFPWQVFDELGNEITRLEEKGTKLIDLKESDAVVLPWNRDRFNQSIIGLKNQDFKYDKLNHMSHYYQELDICFVYNGLHSISTGIGYEKGEIYANIIKIEKLFDNIYTDGLFWYNSHTDKKIVTVSGDIKIQDFRIAILYELARMKYMECQH